VAAADGKSQRRADVERGDARRPLDGLIGRQLVHFQWSFAFSGRKAADCRLN
jgi:hypothetical protein